MNVLTFPLVVLPIVLVPACSNIMFANGVVLKMLIFNCVQCLCDYYLFLGMPSVTTDPSPDDIQDRGIGKYTLN